MQVRHTARARLDLIDIWLELHRLIPPQPKGCTTVSKRAWKY